MMTMESDPPDGVYHYTFIEEVPFELSKYWHQKDKIFSRYSEGIWMTDDAWFGVTPEPVALKIAEHVATAPESKTTIIDCFGGAGGNAIAFALSGRWKRIFAVEMDPKTLACAKHNASLYGVSDKIFWINGDIFDVLQNRLKSVAKEAVLFGSPPWGGPAYTDPDIFDLAQMEPYSLEYIHKAFVKTQSTEIALYLPRNSDLRQLGKTVNKDERAKVMHYAMYGASKALCIYYGNFGLENTGYDYTSIGQNQPFANMALYKSMLRLSHLASLGDHVRTHSPGWRWSEEEAKFVEAKHLHYSYE